MVAPSADLMMMKNLGKQGREKEKKRQQQQQQQHAHDSRVCDPVHVYQPLTGYQPYCLSTGVQDRQYATSGYAPVAIPIHLDFISNELKSKYDRALLLLRGMEDRIAILEKQAGHREAQCQHFDIGDDSKQVVEEAEDPGRSRNSGAADVARAAAEGADRDPNKPKKPQNAYLLWLGENRASLSKEVGSDITKVSKLAGERWKALPEKTKAPFEKKAAELKAVYDKAMAEYKKTVGDDGGDPKPKAKARAKSGGPKGSPAAESGGLAPSDPEGKPKAKARAKSGGPEGGPSSAGNSARSAKPAQLQQMPGGTRGAKGPASPERSHHKEAADKRQPPKKSALGGSSAGGCGDPAAEEVREAHQSAGHWRALKPSEYRDHMAVRYKDPYVPTWVDAVLWRHEYDGWVSGHDGWLLSLPEGIGLNHEPILVNGDSTQQHIEVWENHSTANPAESFVRTERRSDRRKARIERANLNRRPPGDGLER